MRLPILWSLNFQVSPKLFTLHESKSFKSSWNLVSHMRSTWRQLIVLWKLQNRNIKSSGHNARSALLYTGDFREQLIYDSYRFDIGRSRASRLITNVSTPEWDICISPILFLIISNLLNVKVMAKESGTQKSLWEIICRRLRTRWTRSLRGNARPMWLFFYVCEILYEQNTVNKTHQGELVRVWLLLVKHTLHCL